MPDRVQRHEELCQELHDLYIRKNHDYGDSFHKSYQEYGVTMILIRLEDKLNRLKTLSKEAAQVDGETILDTFMDLANYSLMGKMELEGAPPSAPAKNTLKQAGNSHKNRRIQLCSKQKSPSRPPACPRRSTVWRTQWPIPPLRWFRRPSR